MTRIAFLMDPIEVLDFKKDSTLAMIRASQMRNWEVCCLQQRDLMWKQSEPMAFSRSLRLNENFVQGMDPKRAGGDWFELGDEQCSSLSEFDVIMMRKDPPFDMGYIYSTYFLEGAAKNGVMVVNRPDSLRDCNEKYFATEFAEFMPPTVVSQRYDVLLDFHVEYQDVVYKQLDGMGGKNVFRVRADDPNLRTILEMLTHNGQQQIMGQKYLPEIVNGDKRILLIDGEPLPYALARIPMNGETRGNLAAGGTGVGCPLSDRDAEIANSMGVELRSRGLIFTGIDVIGDYLTEVNVTCPTCIRELDAQFGLDIAGMLMDAISERLK